MNILMKIDKTSENNTDQIESQNIYAFTACMFSNAEGPIISFGESLQMTSWNLGSGKLVT